MRQSRSHSQNTTQRGKRTFRFFLCHESQPSSRSHSVSQESKKQEMMNFCLFSFFQYNTTRYNIPFHFIPFVHYQTFSTLILSRSSSCNILLKSRTCTLHTYLYTSLGTFGCVDVVVIIAAP